MLIRGSSFCLKMTSFRPFLCVCWVSHVVVCLHILDTLDRLPTPLRPTNQKHYESTVSGPCVGLGFVCGMLQKNIGDVLLRNDFGEFPRDIVFLWCFDTLAGKKNVQ